MLTMNNNDLTMYVSGASPRIERYGKRKESGKFAEVRRHYVEMRPRLAGRIAQYALEVGEHGHVGRRKVPERSNSPNAERPGPQHVSARRHLQLEVEKRARGSGGGMQSVAPAQEIRLDPLLQDAESGGIGPGDDSIGVGPERGIRPDDLAVIIEHNHATGGSPNIRQRDVCLERAR